MVKKLGVKRPWEKREQWGRRDGWENKEGD